MLTYVTLVFIHYYIGGKLGHIWN